MCEGHFFFLFLHFFNKEFHTVGKCDSLIFFSGGDDEREERRRRYTLIHPVITRGIRKRFHSIPRACRVVCPLLLVSSSIINNSVITEVAYHTAVRSVVIYLKNMVGSRAFLYSLVLIHR